MSGKRVSVLSRRRALLAALVSVVLSAAHATAAERIVHVGAGGMLVFKDDVSGTNQTTIQVGDTVTWVWDGSMSHGIDAGSCPAGGGGGGGGGYGYATYGGGCTASGLWDTGAHAGPFSFSRTFTGTGTFPYFCDVHQGAMTGQVVVQAAATGPCVPDTQTMCLSNGRYRVTADYSAPNSQSGHGTGVPLTGDSGYFWFFSASNIEVVVKVLDGCTVNGNHWVFASGLTNVGVDLTVTDTQTGAVYPVQNSQGTVFQTVTATNAFPSSCP